MNEKVKAFLDQYNSKMPAKGLPFALKQRLDFPVEVLSVTKQKYSPWKVVLNTFVIASIAIVSVFTFWQLGQDSLFAFSFIPDSVNEIVPEVMTTYLEDNTDEYLDWSIYSRSYLEEVSIKLYVGIQGEDFYLFYYVEPTVSLFVRIDSDEGQFMFSGIFDEISLGKDLIETRSNITIDIYVSDETNENTDHYIFRIPKYLEVFNA